MGNIIKTISDGGVPAYLIVFMGLIAMGMIFERVKVLYFDYSIKTDKFMSQIRNLLLNDKVDDAITFSDANKKAPLAHVVKSVLERSDRDEESMHQGLDISLSEIIPLLGKRLGFLMMIANVATLMGLLGTITGLIMAFNAVAFADPSQKQTVLSQGISMAMNTTALGLTVAIPVMVCYAFLHSRQNQLLEEIAEHSTKVVDLLTSRNYEPFQKDKIYPTDINTSKLENKAV